MLIDRFLPDYDGVEHHEVDIDAPVEQAYRAVRELDLARSPVVLALLLVRGLPHLFTGAVKPSRRLGIDEIVRTGFVVLAEEPNREIVLGVVGRFWRLTSGIHRIEPDEFSGFDAPGFAKRRGTSWCPSAPEAARPSSPRPGSRARTRSRAETSGGTGGSSDPSAR